MQNSSGINLTMLCDFYELTMGNGYFAEGMDSRITYFDMFYRSIPDSGGYDVMAGLEQIVDYVKSLHFSQEDISYLAAPGGGLSCTTFRGAEQLASAMFLRADGLSKAVYPGTDIVKNRIPDAYKELIR